MLSFFDQLTSVDLVKIDLEGDTFTGLATLESLRRLWLERCKFPAPAFVDFEQKRGGNVSIQFSAKAFLGVSNAPPRRFPLGQPHPPQVKGACVIVSVVPGEAADRAGMKPGDEVFQIGDQEVRNFDELRVVIAQYEIGEEATIRVRREGKELTLKAKMGTPNDY